jgi:hypothetical protein
VDISIKNLKKQQEVFLKDLKIMKSYKKTEKKFDAVKMMREIRNKLSLETQNMSFEELKVYLKNQIKESKLKPIGK